jgi:RNA polymerase sigma-70 factor (ECF subfamily)
MLEHALLDMTRPLTTVVTVDESAGLRQRDPKAWDAVYGQHVGAVYGCIAALVSEDRQTAEELHQQVWLVAIESIDGFDPAKVDFRSWVSGIARRQVAWHYRRQRVAKTTGNMDSLEVHDGALLPPDVAEQVELGAQVRAAVATLPDESRAILLAKYVDGQSVAEIAGRLGKSVKATESALTRARERLRTLLGERTCSSHATLQGRSRSCQ